MRKTILIALITGLFACAGAAGLSDAGKSALFERPSAEISLQGGDAVLSNKKSFWVYRRMLKKWDSGATATWTFELDEPMNAQNILLNYALAEPAELEFSIAGKTMIFSLKPTGGIGDFCVALLTTMDLPAGLHEVKVSNREAVPTLCLGSVKITAKNPPPFTMEYPEVYVRKDSWAATMVALRAVYRDPAMEAACLHYGEKLDLFLSRKDGRSLWTDFPKESDWFLQDNQVHGAWGKGYFDARQDYKNYLDSDRDNTLEQKLLAQVLQEIDAPQLQKQLDCLIARSSSPDDAAWLELYTEACRIRRQTRLAPLLKETDHIVYAKHMNMGTIYLATETQSCPDGSELRLIDLTPESEGRPLTDELLFDSQNGIVRDPELSFDGKKLLFAWRKTNKQAGTTGRMAPATGNYKIYEMTLADRSMRALTTDETYGADLEPCYLPNGDIMFSSMRCVQEVTCGWGDCSNLYIMNKDGNYARRVGFDQTQTAFPHLLNDGRVVFTRRDYNDRGQSYAHALFVMNTDGTTQTEYYGNTSMVPTSIQHTRAIPGSRKTMGIAGGYHTTQGGKLVVIDPSKGTQNYEGLTFLNWEPTPPAEVNGENFSRVGEQYEYPYPFNEKSMLITFSPIGTYMTASNGRLDPGKEHTWMQYNLYYMTMDGRREILASDPVLSCTQAIPVRPRTAPPTRGSLVDYTKDTGICYVQDVYYGPSAEGIKRGSIKKLRVVELFYKPITLGAGGWHPDPADVGPGRKYASYGWHSVLPAGVGSASFDTKEILGEVEVHEDGSAMFEVPARTPIYFQLVDENGLVVQTMRSWATLMPNERFSCVGCHEENDSAPLPQAMKTMAMRHAPQKLQAVEHITGAPFSYAKVVQPILDKHCISCHAPGKKAGDYDLTGTLVSDAPDHTGTDATCREFNQSYLTFLQVQWENEFRGFNRLDEGRPNEWVNYYTRLCTTELTPPYYAGSTQSGVIKKLLKGHGKTKITASEIGAIAAWIDLNVPSVGEYDEMNIWTDEMKRRYTEKLGMRTAQEQIESENIKAYIEAGQPR